MMLGLGMQEGLIYCQPSLFCLYQTGDFFLYQDH